MIPVDIANAKYAGENVWIPCFIAWEFTRIILKADFPGFFVALNEFTKFCWH